MSLQVSASPAARCQLAGARARGNGDAWEAALQTLYFKPLVTRGHVVRVDKLGPPCRPVWDSRRSCTTLVPTAPGPADFWLLLPGGLSAVVEAKSTADARFYLDEIPDHQRRHLDQAAAAGAGAFLALEFRTGPTSTAYLVPWDCVAWQKARTAESVTAADLAPWVIRCWQDVGRLLLEP